MQFISKEQYDNATEQVKAFEERQARCETFRQELGARLQEFEKFNFKRNGNRIIFAGYIVDKNNNCRVLIGESKCDIKVDKFDFMLGKLISVRRAIGLDDISDIVEIVEPRCIEGIICMYRGIPIYYIDNVMFKTN